MRICLCHAEVKNESQITDKISHTKFNTLTYRNNKTQSHLLTNPITINSI